MAEGFIVVGLDGEGGVVRSGIEEGRLCEVEQDLSLRKVSWRKFHDFILSSSSENFPYCYLNGGTLPSFGRAGEIAKGSLPSMHLVELPLRIFRAVRLESPRPEALIINQKLQLIYGCCFSKYSAGDVH